MNFLDPRLPERFWDKVSPEPNSGCWLWLGNRTGKGNGHGGGYGRFHWNRRWVKAHRVAFAVARGELAPGLDVDHRCRVRCCVNPAHLEAVSRRENVRRGNTGRSFGLKQRAKTHCPQGRPYDERNTRWSGTSHCRRCNNGARRSG